MYGLGGAGCAIWPRAYSAAAPNPNACRPLRAKSEEAWQDRARGPALRRLTWQEFRQARWLILLFTSVSAFLLFWTYVASDPQGMRIRLAFGIVQGGGQRALMGACVFLCDQERSQFRFFAERPVNPRLVWFHRHAIWLAVIAVWLGMVLVIWSFSEVGNLSYMLNRIPMNNDGRVLGVSYFGGLYELPAIFVVACMCWSPIRAGRPARCCYVAALSPDLSV